ncbi:helix-turn-helix domain-containing protein, partial [Bacillus licheniformis]
MGKGIGKKIRELRDKEKLSQSELAERMNKKFKTNLNKGMISKWENELG